jgi:hypothetical protein
MKQLIKKTLSLSTIYYTVAIIAFCLIMLLSHSGADALSLDPSRLLYIYPFCFSFALANTILKHTEIPGAAKWLLHFALTVISAYAFIIVPAKLEASSGNFMGLMIILAIYIVGVLTSMLFSKRIKSAIREDAEIKKNIKSK